MQKRSNKNNTVLYDRYYLQNWKAIKYEKIANHRKYRKPNVPSHPHNFWLNFDIANHDLLHPCLLMGKTKFQKNAACGNEAGSFRLPRASVCLGRDDKNLRASFEWGATWLKMPRINAFSRNVSSKNLPTHVECKSLRENSASILETDKVLESL